MKLNIIFLDITNIWYIMMYIKIEMIWRTLKNKRTIQQLNLK